MSSTSSSHSGQGIINNVKEGLTSIHGAGEAIRGTFNETIDTAFHDKVGVAKNDKIVEKGLREMEGGKYKSGIAGVGPADTKAEQNTGTRV
ncbi:MAG: hypothetical protein M1834_000753 [Cirrosporium novae-zelandiae]|nr:MAG: hypothetical protein M1834_000753 [Cirrosporium novae-zelandiae]